MPSYKILKEEVTTMDRVAGVVYEVELKADNNYSEIQKYFAIPATKLVVLEEATRSFQNSQPVPMAMDRKIKTPVEVRVTL